MDSLIAGAIPQQNRVYPNNLQLELVYKINDTHHESLEADVYRKHRVTWAGLLKNGTECTCTDRREFPELLTVIAVQRRKEYLRDALDAQHIMYLNVNTRRLSWTNLYSGGKSCVSNDNAERAWIQIAHLRMYLEARLTCIGRALWVPQ